MKSRIFSVFLFIFGAFYANAEIIEVHGTVLSKIDGEPLIGATVIPVSNPSAGVARRNDPSAKPT